MYFMKINVFLMREECRSNETVSGRFICPTVFFKFWETVRGNSSINTSIVIRTWKVTPFWKQNGKGFFQNLITMYKLLYLYSARLPIHIPTHDRGQKPIIKQFHLELKSSTHKCLKTVKFCWLRCMEQKIKALS